MKSPYPDLIERLLLQPGTLERLFPTEWFDPVQVSRVREATEAELTGGRLPKDPACVPLLRALLLYRFDAIDDAHRIVQDDASGPGAYLHGMIHRREGDLDNARYWFRRTGPLTFFGDLHRVASAVSPDAAKQSDWDPYLFVGLVEQARFGASDLLPMCVALQMAEFDVVLADVWRRGFGVAGLAGESFQDFSLTPPRG